MSEKALFLSEIRICPECQLAATRRPELDTETQLAFRCPSHWHIVVFEDLPKVEPKTEKRVVHRAATDAAPVTDAPKDKV